MGRDSLILDMNCFTWVCFYVIATKIISITALIKKGQKQGLWNPIIKGKPSHQWTNSSAKSKLELFLATYV